MFPSAGTKNKNFQNDFYFMGLKNGIASYET
jgi:hypothetical protein